MGKLILVTGGAGFVGSRLCERLHKEGHTVISLDNYFAGSRENHVPGVEYREGHTKDIERHVPETPDLVFHLGEYSRVEQSMLEPEVVHDLNIEGTKGVVEFWKKKKMKLVYAGSSTKFGNEGWAKEAVPYVVTKAANTELVKSVGEAEHLPYAITYFYNVYGPGERAGVYGTVIEAFRQMYRAGAPIAVTSPGTQLRNFTHIDDIVDALMLVGEKGQGDEYGLGNERSFSILEVAKLFGGEVVMLPPRAGSRMSSGLDTSKISALGWKPTRTLEGYIKEFTESHARGASREKRVLVFSTTLYPIGPAEEALIELMRQMPDVSFDIVTTKFSKAGMAYSTPVPNATVYRVGIGRQLDKFLLPLLGYLKALSLTKKHRYLFVWSIMASYAALAALFLKQSARIPLLITLADQRLNRLTSVHRMFFRAMLTRADQVYGMNSTHEAHAAALAKRTLSRVSLGDGDAFANQLRYAYAERLLTVRAVAKKKVLIFSLGYFPKHVGGAEVAIKEITDRMPDIEFHMIANRYDSTLPKVEQVGNVLVYRIGLVTKNPSMADLRKWPLHANKFLYQFAAAKKALELHRKYRYDASWAEMAHSCGVPAAIFKHFAPDVKYLLNLQEGDPPEYIERTMRPLAPLFKLAFTSADVIQPLSNYLAAWARRMGYTGPIEIIPNAVAYEHFAKEEKPGAVEAIREKLGKKPGDVFVITTSRLVHKNAVDDVIRALALLPENIYFIVLGTGPDEEMLRKLAKDQGVESRVKFLGHIGHEEMPAYLKASDIFTRPSRSEGFGASFPEAMAAGLPVITTQEGGISDFLFDKARNPDKPTTGWAVDKDAPDQIAAAVKDIIAHPGEVKTVVTTADAMVKEKYNWNLIAREMHALLGRLMKG